MTVATDAPLSDRAPVAPSPARRVVGSARPPRVAPVAVGVFLLAVLAAGAYLVSLGDKRYRDLYEEPDIATHIARGHGFLTPLDDRPDAIPTSWCSPVYPYLMAGVYKVLGIETRASLNVMLGINAACHGLVAAAATVLGAWVFFRAAGAVAGAMVAVHPIFLLRVGTYWDTLPALAMFAWVVVAAVAIRQSGRGPTILRMAGLGAGLGVLALTNASYTLAYPLIVLLAAWGRGSLPRVAGWAGAALLAFAVVCTPWTVRNYRVFDKLFYIRGGVNMEMWLANQPASHGWVITQNHPRVNLDQRRQMLAMGEIAYYDQTGHRFNADHAADPSRIVWRSWNRLYYLWFGDPKEEGAVKSVFRVGDYAVDKILINGTLGVLGLAGAWAAWRLRYRAGWVLPVGFAAAAPFVLTYISYRYVLPTRLMLVLLTGFLLAAVAQRLRHDHWPEPARA